MRWLVLVLVALALAVSTVAGALVVRHGNYGWGFGEGVLPNGTRYIEIFIDETGNFTV